MTTLLLIGVGVAALILAIIGTYLLCLNWSPKVIAPIAVIFLGGLLSSVITTLFILEESTIKSSFPVYIVVDRQNNIPPLAFFNSKNSDTTRRLLDFGSLALSIEPSGRPSSSNFDEVSSFCRELLQFKIVKEIDEVQRRAFSQELKAGRLRSTIHSPIALSDETFLDGKSLRPILTSNRFANSPSQELFYEFARLKLPKGTILRLNPGQVILEKSRFFLVNIKIQTLGTMGPGRAFPEAIDVKFEDQQKYQTFTFAVHLTATFDKLTAQNKRTEEYKKWVEWLFNEIRNELAD